MARYYLGEESLFFVLAEMKSFFFRRGLVDALCHCWGCICDVYCRRLGVTLFDLIRFLVSNAVRFEFPRVFVR